MGEIEFTESGMYPLEARYFYFGEYGDLGKATGSDTPLLHLSVKQDNGAWSPVTKEHLNVVGEPTSPLCPSQISDMRIGMQTTNTSIPDIRSCSVTSLSLPPIYQWATSYKIFLMANDRMPSSISSAVGFGTTRACGRKFCYINSVDGPDIELSMMITDGKGLLGRRKNIRFPSVATFPANVLHVASEYDVTFNVRGLSLSTVANASDSSSISFETPVWDAAPGVAEVSVTGAFPEFMGCVNANEEFQQQKSSANIRVLSHERYTDMGASKLKSSPFKQCWNTCYNQLSNEEERGKNLGVDPTSKSPSVYGKRPIEDVVITDAQTWINGVTKGALNDAALALDGDPETSFSIAHPLAVEGPPSLFLNFQPTEIAWVKITNCDDVTKFNWFNMFFKMENQTIYQRCQEEDLKHVTGGTMNFPCQKAENSTKKVTGIQISPQIISGGSFQLCEVEVVGFKKREHESASTSSGLGERCAGDCGFYPGTRIDGRCSVKNQCPPGECCGKMSNSQWYGCSKNWCQHSRQHPEISMLEKNWCFKPSDNSAFTTGTAEPKCDNDVVGNNLQSSSDEKQVTLSIALKKNGGLVTRPPLFTISFVTGGQATAMPSKMYGSKITVTKQGPTKSYPGPTGAVGTAVVVKDNPRSRQEGYIISWGEEEGFPLAPSYTLSIWVKGIPRKNAWSSLFRASNVWNTVKQKWEFGSYVFFGHGWSQKMGQYLYDNPFGSTGFTGSIKYSDLFEESEWVRLTLVAVDGNTLVYKNSDLIGTMPYATSSNIQYLGAYQNRNMYFSAQIADFSYWDVPLEPFEIAALNGVQDQSVGVCVCSLSSLKVAKARYMDKAKCKDIDKSNNIVEVFTSTVRTFKVRESFEFVWPYPKPPNPLQLEDKKSRSINMRWGTSEDFNSVPVFGTYVVIDYAAVRATGDCPDLTDSSWKRHEMQSPMPCLVQIEAITIGGTLSESSDGSEQLLVPDTEYCFRVCCAATPFSESSSMASREDFQKHVWSEEKDSVSSCPSNEWNIVKGRTALPDPPLRISDDDIQIVEQDHESLTVKWLPLTKDTSVTDYILFVVEQEGSECEVIYTQNSTVDANVTRFQIRGLKSLTAFYVGVAAKNIGGIVDMKDIGRTTGSTTSKDMDLFVCHSENDDKDNECHVAAGKKTFETKIHIALKNMTETGQRVFVYPGRYDLKEGPLNFVQHKVVVCGLRQYATTTILDCQGHRCFEPRNKCELLDSSELERRNSKPGVPTETWNGPYWGSWPFAAKISYLTLTNGSSPTGETGGLVYMAMDWRKKDYEKIQYITTFLGVHFQHAKALHGGCLSVDNRKVDIQECSFSHCHATASGGAIAVSGDSVLISTLTTFQNNTAATDSAGGDGCTEIIRLSDVIGGGAITAPTPPASCPGKSPIQTNPAITLSQNTFHLNTCPCGEGGSLHMRQVLLTVVDSTFKESSARSGGAVFLSKSTATLSGSLFEGNHATFANGGALEILGTSTSVSDCELKENDSPGMGGAMFFVFSDVSMIESRFMSNRAASGGAMSLGFSSTLVSFTNTFKGNKAELHGGALLLSNVNQWSSEKDYFDLNEGDNGGCISIRSPMKDNLAMKSPTLTGCTAKSSGGAVYFESQGRTTEGITLRASSVTARGNKAIEGAGGVFFWTKESSLMKFSTSPAVVSSFVVNEDNSANVGGTIASGPCLMIQWSGPLDGPAARIDRTSVDTTFGQVVDREEAKQSDPSLFTNEVVAGENIQFKIGVLDWYANHLKIFGDINAAIVGVTGQEKALWQYGKELETPEIAGKRTSVMVNGVGIFSSFRIAARPGAVVRLKIESSSLGPDNVLSFLVRLRYCQAGESLSVLATPFCQLCSTGLFSNVSGFQVPMNCPKCKVGQYQPLTGRNKCVFCKIGRYRDLEASSRPCNLCPAGQSQNQTGSPSCVRCQKGRFRDATLSKLLDGTVNDGSICDVCPIGKHTPHVGSQACVQCPKGTFGNSEMNVLDIDGKIRDITRCQPCPSGRWSVSLGATSVKACLPCASGKYQPKTGSEDCVSCAVRKWTSLKTGESQCVFCPTGKFSTPDGDRCQNCGVGDYQNITGQMKCESCSEGTWTFGLTGASVCTPCTASQVFSIETRLCMDCADPRNKNRYALLPGENQLECRHCPEGGICRGDNVIIAKPGWWLGGGLDSDREHCAPNPRKPPRRCGVGAYDCVAENFKNQFFDQCDVPRYLIKCAVQRTDGQQQVCNPRQNKQINLDHSSNTSTTTSGLSLVVSTPSSSPPLPGLAADQEKYDDKNNGTNIELEEGQAEEDDMSSFNAPNGDDAPGGGIRRRMSSSSSSNNTTNNSFSKNDDPNQCLCTPGVECYTGRMCESCAPGYVRAGVKECKYCSKYPIPVIQFAGFFLLLLILMCLFVKGTVASAGSSSPSGSMKKIVINFLQLESLALGFPFQWPEMVTNMFSSMGLVSSANADVFVIECIFPSHFFDVLPAVYQKTIIVVLLPMCLMLVCGGFWFAYDHLCKSALKKMNHTLVPQHLYDKHAKHNRIKSNHARLERELAELDNEEIVDNGDGAIVQPLFTKAVHKAEDEDFGFIYRRALESAAKHHIDVEASFRYFTQLQNKEEISEEEKIGNIIQEGREKGEMYEDMSTAAFEHMLAEWKSPIENNKLLWKMLERIDTDGSGSISITELQAFERSTMDRWVLSSTVVAYMFYPTCCKAAFLLISCRNGLFDGAFTSYMTDDLEQPCWHTMHASAVMMIGIPTLIVWVIGMPLYIFVVLESHRRKKHNDKIRFRYGMLMEGYDDDYFFWESVIASRKMFVIGVSIFMSSYSVDIQAYCGILIVIFFMTMHISANPYNSDVLDRMEKYALATAFVTLYVGMLFYIAKDQNINQNILAIVGSIFILGINIVYIIFAVREVLIFYASEHRGLAHKIMVKCCVPVCNVMLCRGKKARAKLHFRIHKKKKTVVVKITKNKNVVPSSPKKISSKTKVAPERLLSRDDDKRKEEGVKSWGT